jgi:DNA polymerase-3 subunit delta
LKDASFLDDASTIPMFGERKVLYVKDAAALEKSWSRIKEYLEQYLEQPSAETILIFDLESWEGRSKLKALLTKKSVVVEFNPLSEKEIPSWVTSHLRTLQFEIERDGIDTLTERLGSDLQRISAELEKLMLLKHAEKKITAGDVESTVGYSNVASIWAWTDAILDQDAPLAIQLMQNLLENEAPLYRIAILAKQYEKMIIAKEMVQQRVPQATIAQKIHKPAYYLQAYLNQLGRYTMSDLVKAFQILSFADRALKSSQAGEATIMDLVVTQLCNLKAPVKAVFDVPLAG